MPRRDQPVPALPAIYGQRSLRTLRAAIAALRPHDGGFDVQVDENVLRTALSFVPYLPPPLRFGLPVGLLLLEFAPPLFRHGMQRFSRMSEDSAVRYLEQWESGPAPCVLIFQSLRALVLIAFYQQPEILAELEIDWQGRADELTERRARLLRMAPELGNPRNSGVVKGGSP